MKLLNIICSLAAVLGTSCVGTEIGNPPTPIEAQVSVDMLAIEEAPEMPMPTGLIVADGIEIDRAVMLIGDLRFRRAETCSEQVADRTDGFVSELLESGVELTDIGLPVGDYCGLDMRPERGGAESGLAVDQPELEGLTSYAEGTYMGTPFVIRNESDDDLEFQDPFTLPEGNQVIFVAVDVAAWLDGVDFETLEPNEDGVLVVGHDGEYEELVKDNFLGSVSIALDRDGDRMLTSEDEDDD